MPAPTGEVLRVSNELLERIVAGAYPSGLRLPPEVELASDLGCARSTLREALRHLAGLGVVKSRRGSGVTVLDFRREGGLALLPQYLAAGRFEQPMLAMAREILHVRAMLAGEAARLAAMYARPGSLRKARELAGRLPSLEAEPAAYTQLEVELYRELLCASEMWPVVWFANGFWEPVRSLHAVFSSAIWYAPPRYGETLQQLFAAIEAHDAERASGLVRAHFRAVDEHILPRLEQQLSPAADRPTSSNDGQQP